MNRSRAAVAIGQAVKGAIVQANLNQDLLASAVGLSINSMSRRLNGHLPFTYPELRAVAAVTGVPVSELIATAERIETREPAVAS